MNSNNILVTLLFCVLVPNHGSERLTVSPAYALPEFNKFTAVSGTTNRFFITAFTPGDFNGDGRADLAVETGEPHAYPDIYPQGVKVFLQNASGGFEEKAEYPLPGVSVTFKFNTGDFNEDGHLDILMEASDDDMLLMTGKGDGTFSDPNRLGLGAAGYFATADLDGDQHLDLVAGLIAEGTVGVFKGKGDGTFELKTVLNTPISASFPRRGEVNLGDINRDGKIDIAVSSWLGLGAGEGNLDVYPGKGDGTFEPVVQTFDVPRGAEFWRISTATAFSTTLACAATPRRSNWKFGWVEAMEDSIKAGNTPPARTCTPGVSLLAT